MIAFIGLLLLVLVGVLLLSAGICEEGRIHRRLGTKVAAPSLVLLLLLVPGWFGLPAHGAQGAAWATFGARAFLLAGLAAYIVMMKEARDLGVFRKPDRDRAAERAQREVGYGAGVSNFFEVASFASLNIIAGWIGGLAVAAWTAVLNVASVVFMVPLGLATATAVLVGRGYGARDLRPALVTGDPAGQPP